MIQMPEIRIDAVEAARELRELRRDRERLDWLGASRTEGRFPGCQFDGSFSIRDIYGMLLGEGQDLRAAVDDAMAKEPKCPA